MGMPPQTFAKATQPVRLEECGRATPAPGSPRLPLAAVRAAASRSATAREGEGGAPPGGLRPLALEAGITQRAHRRTSASTSTPAAVTPIATTGPRSGAGRDCPPRRAVGAGPVRARESRCQNAGEDDEGGHQRQAGVQVEDLECPTSGQQGEARADSGERAFSLARLNPHWLARDADETLREARTSASVGSRSPRRTRERRTGYRGDVDRESVEGHRPARLALGGFGITPTNLPPIRTAGPPRGRARCRPVYEAESPPTPRRARRT